MTSQNEMFAYRYVPGTTDVVLEHLPVPGPQEGEVLLRVEAAGLCHSDVGPLPPLLEGDPLTRLVSSFTSLVGSTGASDHWATPPCVRPCALSHLAR